MKNLLVLILSFLLFSGCTSNLADNYTTMLPDTNIEVQKSEVKELSSGDFVVHYNEQVLTVGMKVYELIDALGQGTANEDNNFGFVGWDTGNKYKHYSRGYPADNPDLTVYSRLEVVSGESVINQIDISQLETKRKIMVGNSVDDLIEVYGVPSSIDNETYSYKLNDVQLKFVISSAEQTITQIMVVAS